MSDLESLLAACIAQPDEDTPRLMLADELDSRDMPEWAELVRLQVKMFAAKRGCRCGSCVKSGQHHNGPCAGDRVYVDDQSGMRCHWRERELLADEAKLRRGVLSESLWVNAEGKTWEWLHRVTFVRGLPCVECTLAECGAETQIFDNITDYREDRSSRMEWIPSAFAVAAMRESGCSVRVSDRVPYHIPSSDYRWWRAGTGNEGLSQTLPASLYDTFAGSQYANQMIWRSADEARAALDAAVNRLTFAATWPQLAGVTA